MDGEQDDVHLNITQLLRWEIHIGTCNKNMYESPI